MKNIKHYLVLILTVTLFACSNDNDDNSQIPVPVQNPTTAGFLYAENGGSTMSSVTTPYASGMYKSIFAVDNSNTIFEINLTSIAVGSYTIDDSTNFLSFLKPGATGVWTGSAGTVTITANANNKLTGTFSVSTGSGISGVNSVAGSFTDIPIQ